MLRRVVLVTGAGASTDLGKGKPLPLMAKWANILLGDMQRAVPGMPAAFGFGPDMSGPEFEEILGAMLRWQGTFPLNRRFERVGDPRFGGVPTQVSQWMSSAEEHGRVFEQTLFESLWREFSVDAISVEAARSTYATLLDALDLRPIPFVCATTNYDLSIEVAMQNIGLSWTDGFDNRALETPRLRPQGIIDWDKKHDGKVPILHLHGAVGWYRRPGEDHVRKHPSDQEFNKTHGTPAVITPDPNKEPESDPSVGPMWREFRTALAGASHVIVIGHSLTDEPLVRTLSAARGTAVAVVNPNADENTGKVIPGTFVVPSSFGPDGEMTEMTTKLNEWLMKPVPTDAESLA